MLGDAIEAGAAPGPGAHVDHVLTSLPANPVSPAVVVAEAVRGDRRAAAGAPA
ncbi:hypothetical protein MO973_41115 [Paenibacillus sp. TRM 82003]|uniref:hypothetical protein n=1 Tax=Kineococcus sp. TRM81007 TaxID=2925831 RepID=UPI001F57A62D|nr:hypothetical protein [Kineococcus sp. TRM81007]MCI2237009.1 hypothetical protein [Kineococcus sp. TRM81007]MCI3926596.1 hypothetical protein [Paenibacillus sp. TRM 82003]